MAAESMRFPETVDEFMEQYKIVDTEQVYTNGTELVPIFRMQQWFEHLPAADVRPVVLCKDCRHRDPEDNKCDCGQLERAGCVFPVDDNYWCAHGEKGETNAKD